MGFVVTIGTATHVAQARALEAAGVDVVCAQGSEAGAHRGTFIGEAEDALIGNFALIPPCAGCVRRRAPRDVRQGQRRGRLHPRVGRRAS